MIDTPNSIDVFGLKITPLSLEEILDLIADSIKSRAKTIILNQNLHGAYIFFRDKKFRDLHLRSYVHIDGMPIVWLSRLKGYRLGKRHRVTYVDLVEPLLKKAAASGWRVYYLGSRPEILEVGIARLRKAIPGLSVDGHHGYFDPAPSGSEARAVVVRINEFRPSILIVGMGMPRQEHWVADHENEILANCVLVSGAYIEYVAGQQPTPPRWLGPLGFEWLYRLITNPRRYGWRYLAEPWLLLWLLCKHVALRSRRG